MEIADYIIADDRALVELVLQGDNIAFEYLFERYKEAIHRLFIQRTNNPLDADDLLQETFIKVYINIHRYNPAYTFGQWVYTIARNTFVDFIRRRQEDLPIDDKFTAPPSNLRRDRHEARTPAGHRQDPDPPRPGADVPPDRRR